MLLGWARWQEPSGRKIDFYVRQLWDGKGKIDVEGLGPKRLAAYAGLCGKTLAFAHARSGDAMMIRGYIGNDKSFDDVMVAYASDTPRSLHGITRGSAKRSMMARSRPSATFERGAGCPLRRSAHERLRVELSNENAPWQHGNRHVLGHTVDAP